MNILRKANAPEDRAIVETKRKDLAKSIAGIRVREIARRSFSDLCKIQREGMNFLWDHPAGITPQEVCDSLGEEAGDAFALHGALTQGILDIAAAGGGTPDIIVPPNAFTINEDGTVTIGEPTAPVA